MISCDFTSHLWMEKNYIFSCKQHYKLFKKERNAALTFISPGGKRFASITPDKFEREVLLNYRDNKVGMIAKLDKAV